MTSCKHFIRSLAVNSVSCALPFLILVASMTQAQVWDGGNATNHWHDAGNWNPDGLPTSSDVAVLDSSLTAPTTVILTNSVEFGVGGGLDGLTIAEGFDLDTNGFAIHVDDSQETGLTDITGTGSSLIVRSVSANPASLAYRTDRLLVRGNGLLAMRGGNARVDTDAEVRVNGLIQGYGSIVFGGPSASGILLDNKGTIAVSLPQFATTGTLRLAMAANAPAGTRLSLSGATGAGRLTVNNGIGLGAVSLIVDAETEDFEGVLDIGQADSAEFTRDLTLFGGTIEFNGGLGVATLKGAGRITNIGGGIQVNSGTARIENDVALGIASNMNVTSGAHLILANTLSASSSATIEVGTGGTIQFDGSGSSIAASNADFRLGDQARLLVHGSLTIDSGTTARFDWDGSAENAETIVHGPSAALRIIGSGIDPFVNGHQGGVTIQDGGLVEVSLSGTAPIWLKEGTLTLSSQSGSSSSTLRTAAGGRTQFSNVAIAALGTGTSIIDADRNMFFSGEVTAASDATLRIKNSEIYAPMSWGNGNGTLQNSVSMMVAAETTMNFSTVDLDGPNGTATVALIDSLTLNVDRISQNASNVFGQFNQNATATELVIGPQGRLDVQFHDPSTTWTIGELARVELFALAGPGTEQIAGADVVIHGDVQVNAGNSRWTARTDLQNTSVGNAAITIAAGSSLTLEGGTLQNPNRIEGGRIDGDGQLRAPADHALHGFGRIDTDIRFTGPNSTLFAADQDVLVVNGDVLAVGRIGTANSNGTLLFGSPFDTSVANVGLELHGGSIVGAAIINDGVTIGFGTVRSQQFVQNGSGTTWAIGGQLVVDVVDPQINVTQGTINAVGGDLVFTKPFSGDYLGVVNVGPGHAVTFANGWVLSSSSGRLNLAGGMAPAAHAMVAGDVRVGSGAIVNVNQHGTFADEVVFDNLATVNLPGAADILHLVGGAQIPFHGSNTARFQGNGTLINEGTSILDVDHGVTIHVDVANRGALTINALDPGTMEIDGDYTQHSTGIFHVDVHGPTAGQFDVLEASGAVRLAGALDVLLASSYAPLTGQAFPIIVSEGGITGEFDTTAMPELLGAIALDVAYETNGVLLQVVSLPDFNGDGNLDCVDVDSLVGAIVAGTNNVAFDMTGDGMVDDRDLRQWLTDAGAVNLPSGNAYLAGDANLDGLVDGSDFGVWNANKFTATAAWCSGDFNADGVIDGSDFGAWNSNKFTSANAQAVPEPVGLGFLLITIGLLMRCDRRGN